jgi:hypothetical protein
MMRYRFDSAIWTLALCLLGVAAPGCHKEDIQSYAIPSPVDVKDEPDFGAAPRERMLGAVIPHGDEVWFLKLQGPVKAIDAHRAAFDQVLRSFRFVNDKDKPVAWTTPTGWTSQPESENRYATLKLDSKETPLELTITRLPGTGNIVANVNRWRGQLSLNPVTWAAIPKVTTQVKLESATAICTDFVGVSKRSAAMARAAERPEAQDAKAAEGPPLEFTVPNGWTALPDQGGAFSPVVAFRVVEGSQEATIKVTKLAGQIPLANNVDRWRDQVKLPAATPEELKRDVREFSVGGINSPYVDLVGPKSAKGEPQRLLVVAVVQGASTWYFKLLGPAELVGRQKPAFEAFMSSVRFKGGSNG